MDFVIPGQYTGSGWGIDRIGIRQHASGRISVYHFEMKFVTEGATHVPTLGTPRAGTQTGLSWTRNAIDGFLTSQKPEARAMRERLRRAMQSLDPGKTIDINSMRTFLNTRLRHAPVRIFVPDYADLSKLYRQTAALARWGRNIGIVKVKL
jgi:hypothetical protein